MSDPQTTDPQATRRWTVWAEIIWFTRESWKYMSGRNRPIRFLLGYPKALWRFMMAAESNG